MFERYLTDALTTHFGHVVDNLDADKVRLSAWSGELVLKDLSLRPTALASFVADCPVEIAYGKVGNLELSIPWKLFGSHKLRRANQEESSRCSVVLSDVNILITPRRETKRQTPDNDDEDLESSDTPEERRLKKEKQVQSLLDADLLQRVAKSSLSSSRWKWVQDWLAGLLSTLSVTVKNIHIRYEDPGTSMGFVWSSNNGGKDSTIRKYRPSFAVGITLREFSVLTRGPRQQNEAKVEDDEDRKVDGKEPAPQQPSNIAPVQDFLVRHKVAAADKLAIYWDSDCQLISLYVDQTEGREQQSAQYQSSFGILNDVHNYQLNHSYVLDPISPEINLTLVSKAAAPKEFEGAESSDSEDSTNDSVSPHTHSPMTPPSNVTISLPPCKLTIARNTLEDTAYIRKSLAVWKHAREGLLSESSLRRLARLRPLKSAREDPQRWWVYASEATLALLRVNRDGRDLGHLELHRKRKRGWLGLAQVLGRRRRYVELYKQMVYAETEDARVESHAALFEMEDDLFEEEIVAFRIALYESLKKVDAVHDAISPKSKSNGKSRWKGWMPSSIGGSSDGDDMGEKSDEDILTHVHRRRMVDEMIVALDREKTNIRKRVQEGVRQASVLRLDPASLAYNDDHDELNTAVMKTTLLCREFALQVNDQSTEKRHRSGIPSFSSLASKPTPVVKLSCAWMQEQAWYEDGSWTAEGSIASLVAKDLIASNSQGSKHSVMRTYFPNLIDRKRGLGIVDEKDAVLIDGQSYHRSVTILVSRQLHWQLPDGRPVHNAADRGSTTRTQIRISPMEVVYSTLPAEALSRVLATVKTPELADDYHRMASAAYEWQERQKMKFLRALAHKHKKIVVDVDVGAPELLIPEDLNRRESPMVAVDLGRLQIFNGEHSREQSSMYDDEWRLIMSNMQVQCTTIAAYAESSSKISDRDLENMEKMSNAPKKIVEPFSLEFTISTKIVSDDRRASDDMTRVHVLATLPRLTFNLTSSAMHLVMRLQQQWERRKSELRDHSMPAGFNSSISRASNLQSSVDNRRRGQTVKSSGDGSTIPGDVPDERMSRTMQFQFSAPVITLRLENDVDGRDCDIPIDAKENLKFRRRTPLIDLSFRGIRGAIVQQVSINGITTTKFDARLHSLGAVDLYQSAGIDYALLMSSVSPETMSKRLSTDAESSWKIKLSENEIDGLVDQETTTDLVMVEFTSINVLKGAKSGVEQSIDHADKLTIQFHELYIEWNPETLAAIQKAIRMPEKVETDANEARDTTKLRCESDDLSDDKFFDALEEEDEFFDAGSETDSVVHLISEISTSAADLTNLDTGASITSANQPLFWYSNGLKSFGPSISPFIHLPSPRKNEFVQEARPYKPFEFEFKLSKLRVSFNKETRHRRVVIAQMDGTSVKYATQPAGGSRTKMSIGNLVFTDPDSSQNRTLYGQILGLKSDAFTQAAGRASSLLEMEIVLNPKTRGFITVDPTGAEEHHINSVKIDREKGVVLGCNTFVRATFSPMRFVFLEQLWFEIIDYFFEGVLGAAVWGGSRSSSTSSNTDELPGGELDTCQDSLIYLPGSDAEGLKFTRFDISIDSPAVLLPVTYCSTQCIRLELKSIHLTNRYDSRVSLNGETSADQGELPDRMQWYNNCDVCLKDLRIFSWCGQELGKNAVVADVLLNWPVGPTAPLVVPKWKVDCRLNSLDISLRRSDYALLQNIISHNIGEVSRYLDEWEALQNLSPEATERYQERVMVHFDYDNKDVAPSTYDLTVAVPSLSFSLIEEDRDVENTLAVARCIDLVWQLRKSSDRVTRQKATCVVDLETPNPVSGFDKMLSLSKYDSELLSASEGTEDSDEGSPLLAYTSTTRPSGDTIKTLDIVGACIYMVVPVWRRFLSFFQALPEPQILSEHDIGASIQVGDRWYKIGGNSFGDIEKNDSSANKSRQLSWVSLYSLSNHLVGSRRRSQSTTIRYTPSSQLRVLLTSPRIILSSIPVDGTITCLILRMHHLDYLQINNGEERKMSKSFFLHDVEVYTTSNENSFQQNMDHRANSLIHPWCVSGVVERCNGEAEGDCEAHSLRISADVLQARAAYSDMAIAIDVCLSVFHILQEENSHQSSYALASPLSTESYSDPGFKSAAATVSSANNSNPDIIFCETPVKNMFDIECDGLELLVVDDSGRHFAGNQDLIILSLGKVRFSREDAQSHPDEGTVQKVEKTVSMKLRLHSLDLFDCLQPEKSPFRLAASSRSGATGLQTVRYSMTLPEDSAVVTPALKRRGMAWTEFSMKADEKWGFGPSSSLVGRIQQLVSERICHGRDSIEKPIAVPSTWSREAHQQGNPPELIEFHSFSCVGVSQYYHVKLRSLALQWNPSTVIAIQRFLGRLQKESKNKAVRVFHQQLDDMMSPQVAQDSEDRVNDGGEMASTESSVSVKAVVEVDSLTICLNKEHQHRRLLEVTLAACRLELESSVEGLRLGGRLGDFNAWDPDNYESRASSDRVTLSHQNRSVLKVAVTSEEFSAGNVSTHVPPKRHVFLEVNYRTFTKKPVAAESASEIPAWVQSHVAETGDIDDYLSLSVAALQFTYLRERTEEILDYLSNGLPGKGMGATSRAAKGFLKKRILTKSFLELHVDSPQVLIPQHEAIADGITLKLGDVSINSWFEKAISPGNFGLVDREKDQAEWWRMLSLRLTGLSGGSYTRDKSSTATKPIDLEIMLRKPTVQGRDLSLRGKLSFVDVTLKYTDYLILRAVARDNFGRKVDTEKWDNVEKKYWMEEEGLDGATQATSSSLRVDPSTNSALSGADVPVAYSSHARFIRYGKKAKKGRSIAGSGSNDSDQNATNATSIGATDSTTLDLKVELDGLSLKLRRDDQVEGAAGMDSISSAFDHDVMLLRVQLVEVSVNTNAGGDISFHLSLFRIGLFDLGDRGRLIRERYLDCLAPKDEGDRRRKRRELRPPCPFSVLVEGYSPSENSAGSSNIRDDDSGIEPQLVVTVDRCPASSAGAVGALADSDLPDDSKVTVAKVVINYLSVNALIRPFQEIAAFLSCSWPTQKVSVDSPGKRRSLVDHQVKDVNTQGVKSVPLTSRGVQLKVVAHYPRIFFLADESDPHSRALVLRGLAVVNVSKITSVMGQEHGVSSMNATSIESRQQIQQLTAVDAQLHSMESYINPDVDDALRFKRRHAEMVGDAVSTSSPAFQYEDTEENERHSSDALGVALIQPVTTGIEYSEMRRDLFPTKRSLFVNMEPVSTMLSFEDLELIEAVLKRWSSERSGSTSSGHDREVSRTPKFEGSDKRSMAPAFESREYEVVFHSARLGLGLKMDSGRIIVDSVQNSDYNELIAVGDTMVSIDGSGLDASLADAVKELSVAARPTTILFSSSRPRTVAAEMAGETQPHARTHDEITEESSELDSHEEDGACSLLNADGLADSYDVAFRVGVPSGLNLEKSACGNFATVKNVLPTFRAATSLDSVDESNAEQIETVNLEENATRVPRIGAVVIAVEGVQAEELGHQEIIRLLENLSGEADAGNGIAANADSPNWKGSYSVSFLELDSSLWGNVDIVDISAAGIALSFIDDFKGRDMPLFRGKLTSVEIHVERGLGIGANILDVPTPTVVKLFCDGDQSVTNLSLARDVIQDLSSDTVVTFSAIAMSTLDYYHPRIAVWEPLLEPSQLFLLLERLSSNGTTRRPGQLAVEVSDCLLREQHFRRNLPTESSEPQMVSVNFTDPAVEVLVKALNQWKEWRQSVAENISEMEEDDDESEEDNGNTTLDQNLNRNKSFPDESLSLTPSTDNINQALVDPARMVTSANDKMKKTSDAKQLATQKAAQAALVYAQKRGADNSKKGATAKPFIFRNRTGVSIAFVRQGRGISSLDSSNDGLRKAVLGHNLSVVGEYIGLEEYDPAAITELPDQEDAKFDMDVLSDQFSGPEVDSSKGTKQVGNKVRNYEGRFPSLTVAIQAVSGVSIDPIDDLQVFKVGSAVRHLCVRKEAGGSFGSVDATNYSIPVVWKVELEDNRRILTLSSAVRVVSSGFDTPIEIGVQIGMGIDTEESSGQNKLRIRAIGVARPGNPFYLPLWLALKLEAVSVYVRPSLEGDALYSWGKSSVLEFGPVLSLKDDSSDSKVDLSDIGKWAWKETFKDLDFIRCDPLTEDLFAVWLSCFDSSLRSPSSVVPSRRRQDKGKHALSPSLVAEESNEVISVTLDSGLTVRNMLPMDLDWEIAHAVGPSTPFIVDGSSTRQDNIDRNGLPSVLYGNQRQLRSTHALKSGECTEVFVCDFKHEHLNARFKGSTDGTWSNWAPLLLPAFDDRVEQMNNEETGRNDSEPVKFPVARQVNVQLTDDCLGAPLTFAIRIIPKMTQPLLDDLSQSSIYGLELIIYAELWIRNLTSLPINFGAPAYQMHESCYDASDAQAFSEQSAARFSAESAIMEIASVLEFGDKGTGFSNKTSRELAETGVVESLPKQRCSALVEEVFEYLEIESSTVKRRWWASESHDSYRENITQSPEESEAWRWVDETWAIDCTGRVKASEGGWESCRNLLGAGSFSGKRELDPSHKFRRRRWFRTRATDRGFNRGLGYEQAPPGEQNQKHEADFLLGGLQAFHQPVKDSFSSEQRKVRQKRKKKKRSEGQASEDVKDIADQDGIIKIAIKSGDGKWSTPATIPPTGTCHGVMRALASRWPTVTKAYSSSSLKEEGAAISANEKGLRAQGNAAIPPYLLKKASLSPGLMELCYTVSDIEGDWGDFSRSMVVYPRFLFRNDSETIAIQVKQTGSSDETAVTLSPGEVHSFYWADFRLPGLVSVRPVNRGETVHSIYRWSGGFDVCNLGMIPIRVRQNSVEAEKGCDVEEIRSIRALVEIRPGTGGSGINVSFKEEDARGDGSLFRIENLSTFPIWLAQDGVLANPSAAAVDPLSRAKNSIDNEHQRWTEDHAASDGDLVQPSGRISYALDIPFRQGKYAHRKPATVSELLRLRVALAPLGSRAGVETVKVIGFTVVGDSVRLNPSKLAMIFSKGTRTRLQRVRVLGIITTDGPIRVLKFCLMEYSESDHVFGNPFADVSYISTKGPTQSEDPISSSAKHDYDKDILKGGNATLDKMKLKSLPSEGDAKRYALFGELEGKSLILQDEPVPESLSMPTQSDQIYTFRAAFSGFIFSLVDSVPSEIAVMSLKNFNVLARWNAMRTTDASVIMSVGWLQVDNHVPNAPFPVAVRPDDRMKEDGTSAGTETTEPGENVSSPLLVVGLAFAPRHTSGIVCLRSVTVAPRNLVIAIDLAFLVRLQKFFVGIMGHFQNRQQESGSGSRAGPALLSIEQKRTTPFPDFEQQAKDLERAAAFGVGNQKLYFEGLTILPCNINLSVAPARALTIGQANLEGKEAAAIHQAVRKGDVLVGGSSAMLGVRVGRRNTTALAVVRGIFKSIVVDALLRLDGASLNFEGVFLRNHISTTPQLTTYLLAHYVASLRHNVPALIGSLAAFGNPLGLIRGLGDGVSDFVSEPVKGLKRSVEELNPSFLVDGVARGTESLARHTVGGFADSASLLTETFSKNMAVLTLDRRYAQKRDRGRSLRRDGDMTVTLVGGVESGFIKLVDGFLDGVTGVVKAPMRGAEKRGIEGFAKGIGKGLLGLLVKPIIGISDAATDVMIGVKSTVENSSGAQHAHTSHRNQFRPRRPMYGRDKVLRPYNLEDAAAATLMLRTRNAGDNYLSHMDMDDRVALLSSRRLVLIGPKGQELLSLKFKHVANIAVRAFKQEDGSDGWGIIVLLNTPRRNGSEVEVICCKEHSQAVELCSHIERGMASVNNDAL